MANRQQSPSHNQLAAGRRKARHYAMQALYQWHMAGQALSVIEAEFQADYDMSNVDKEFFSRFGAQHSRPAHRLARSV